MSLPNHKQEFHDHLMSSFQSDWGKDSSDGQYPAGDKNKYNISAEYRRVQPREFGNMIKNRLNASRGVIVLSHITSNYTPKHMLGKKYDVLYSTIILFGTTALKQNQISGEDRIVYEMERDIMQTLMDHPVHLTDNPKISLTVNDMENEYTDDDIDFNRLRLNFTAQFKD